MRVASRARVLVAEDDADIRALIRLHLEREGCEIDAVASGDEALQKIQAQRYDLYVLDWMLPVASGLEITRRLRGQPETQARPILMVTARIEPADVVAGLEAGADDYVTKPFEIPVLMARVRALLRRAQASTAATGAGSAGAASTIAAEGGPEVLQAGDGELVIDTARHEVRCAGTPVELTPSEFKLLSALLRHQGRVLTRQRLIDLVQGVGVAVVDRAVDTHVFGLRKKLGPCGELIETVRGVGYRIR